MQLKSMWHKQLRLGPAILIYVCVKLQRQGKKGAAEVEGW